MFAETEAPNFAFAALTIAAIDCLFGSSFCRWRVAFIALVAAFIALFTRAKIASKFVVPREVTLKKNRSSAYVEQY